MIQYRKSEPRPKNDADVVHSDWTVVTGNTFNEIVMDPNNEILFEYYPGWNDFTGW